MVGGGPTRAPGGRHAALAAAIISLLFLTPAAALRVPTGAPERPVVVHTLWNRDYLCFAAKVPDPMLTSSSIGPMSAPQQDDALEFCLEMPGPTGPSGHRLVVSAAGGMTVLTRDGRGHWRSDSSWITGPRTVKFAVLVNGTLNDPTDRDEGFVAECAIPWEFLGGAPRADQEIGLNVVCWIQGEAEGVASWSPAVKERAHVHDAARWGKMLISRRPSPMAAQGPSVTCPYVGRTPFVDGKLAADEWLVASTLQFEKPQPTVEISPETPGRGAVPATVLAICRYDWQGAPNRPGGAKLWRPDGTPATSHQPMEAAGPWYSYERVDWHRSQLSGIHRAGIDIILARYRGDEESRHTWARVGLDRMGQALKELRGEGRGYPLVGMFLDTAALGGLDLTAERGERLIYGMIREFFLRVPREFWAHLGARAEQGLPGGVPVLLGEPEGLAGWDGGFLEFCQEEFGRDFGGARIVWLGSTAWRAGGAQGFYAHVRLPEQTGFAQEGAGGVVAVALSPGYCPPPGASSEVRSRREGRAHRADWQRALAAKPELVVINSWNDLGRGTEIAPSRQYGVAYVDMVRYFQSRLGAEERYPLRLKAEAAPHTLRPGTDYQVELLVENLGTEDIRTGRHVTADYRITRRDDGREVQHRVGAQGLEVMAGQTRRLPVVISTRDDQGNPLPPGDYLFSLVAVRSRVAYLRSRWFARPLAEITVPITVGYPRARQAAVVSTSLPSSLEAGATENVVVRLRNDGATAWRASETSLSYHWVRWHDDLSLPSTEAREELVSNGNRAALPRDVAPGEMVSVMISVTAAAADGTPLVASSPRHLWHYRVEWDLVDERHGWFSEEGPRLRDEALQVLSHDWGVRLESGAGPAEMQAGETAQVEVVVANAGHHVWPARDTHLYYRWYRWDGRELEAGAAAALLAEAAPGERVTLKAEVEAPDTAGVYWLAWDLICQGEGFAERVGGRRTDLLTTPVLVRGGRLRTLDISSLLNVAAITTDSYRSRGDFDGEGRSLPAECLPPDLSGAREDLYPSGYYADAATEPLPVPFAFPDHSSGVGGALACMGQSIPLGDRGVGRVHLLAASSARATEVQIGLKHEDGSVEQMPVSVPSWLQPNETSTVGVCTRYIRALGGEEATPAYLYHVTLRPSSPTAVEMELPRASSVKILAVTVEDT